jgi:hypothetical protein
MEEGDANSVPPSNSTGESLANRLTEFTVRTDAEQYPRESSAKADKRGKTQPPALPVYTRSFDDDLPLTAAEIKNSLLLFKTANAKSYSSIRSNVLSVEKTKELRTKLATATNSDQADYNSQAAKGFDQIKPSGTPSEQASHDNHLAVFASSLPVFETIDVSTLTKGHFRDAKTRIATQEYNGPAAKFAHSIFEKTSEMAVSTTALIKNGTQPSALTLSSNVFTFVFLGDSLMPPNAKTRDNAKKMGVFPVDLPKYLHLFLDSGTVGKVGPDFSIPLKTGQMVMAVINPDLFTSKKNTFANFKLIVEINTEKELSGKELQAVTDIAKGTAKALRDQQVARFREASEVTKKAHGKFLAWQASRATPLDVLTTRERAYRYAWSRMEDEVLRLGATPQAEDGGEEADTSMTTSSSANLDPGDGESSKRPVPADFGDGNQSSPKRHKPHPRLFSDVDEQEDSNSMSTL